MLRKLAAIIVLFFFCLTIVPLAHAADVWSDGDWQLGSPTTQQPSTQNPGNPYTELWSENLWQENPPTNPPTPPPNNGLWSENLWQDNPPSTTPSPQMPVSTPDGIHAPKQPTLLQPAVPPVMENGKILIPARDVLEPLAVELQFDPIKQLLTFRKENTIVHLILNNDMAMVNGNMVKLEAPAKIVNGRTFIPLHFLSQALQYTVDFEATTTKVTIDGWLYFYLDASKANTVPVQTQPISQTSFFVGNWAIWIPGGFATTVTTTHGDGSKTITQEYIKGAQGYTLSILANGTYSWQTTGGTITGQWKAEPDGRIVLLKAKYEFDWYVSKINENEIKFYSFGMEEYGTRIK